MTAKAETPVLFGAGRLATILLAQAPAGMGIVSTAAASSVTTLYSFTGSLDGASPYGLTLNNGTLYGVTFSGGYGQGVLYSLPATGGSPTALHTFVGVGDGGGPTGAPVVDRYGNILGTTVYANLNSQGVGSGYGTVYELPSGISTLTTVYTFSGTSNGANPFAGLSNRDASYNYYGTTANGGTSNNGTVYKLTPNGSTSYSLTSLYAFRGGSTDGANPYGGVLSVGNNLYGQTVQGGSSASLGIVYQLSTATSNATPTPIYTFASNGYYGGLPRSGLAIDTAGQLYGTASFMAPDHIQDRGSYSS